PDRRARAGDGWRGGRRAAGDSAYGLLMAHEWQRVPARQVAAGDVVRVRETEITVSRVEHGFLGRAGMVAFVEDSPSRWLKVPAAEDAEVEVRRPA
ncbi:MAG: hypothetical protein ACRDZR_09470, partial [Acidimicrobiales bacterium]